MDTKLLGLNIKNVRITRNKTISEVAEAIGINKATISRYERGEIARPKLPVIESIARYLNVDPSFLVGKTTQFSQFKNNPLKNEVIDKINHLTDEELKKINILLDTMFK